MTLAVGALVAVIALLPVVTDRLSGDNAADFEERATLMRQAWRIVQDNPILGVGSGGAVGGLARVRAALPALRSALGVSVVVGTLGPRMCRLAERFCMQAAFSDRRTWDCYPRSESPR